MWLTAAVFGLQAKTCKDALKSLEKGLKSIEKAEDSAMADGGGTAAIISLAAVHAAKTKLCNDMLENAFVFCDRVNWNGTIDE